MAWRGVDIVGDVASHHSQVGLNWQVGGRWPTKAWPFERWEQLAATLSAQCTVSWQEGFDDVHEYMRWIAGCGSIVTTDSLGMHLAIAMKKPVLALFGPTPSWEVDFYGRGTWLAPSRGRLCVRALPEFHLLQSDPLHGCAVGRPCAVGRDVDDFDRRVAEDLMPVVLDLHVAGIAASVEVAVSEDVLDSKCSSRIEPSG